MVQKFGRKNARGESVQGGEVDEAPGVGLFATFIDTEGNLLSIYEDRSPDPTPGQKALLS